MEYRQEKLGFKTVTGCDRRDKLRNDDIRTDLNVKEPVNKKLK
jgi:hypothetical protein